MENIESTVETILQATNFQINKKILKEKIQTDLHIVHNGGMFKITAELIAFLNLWNESTIYIEDIYENPICVDREVLLEEAKEQYYKVMNYWHNEYEALKKNRKL